MYDTANDRMVLTVEECARLCGISRNLAYQLAREGSLPTIRLGRRILVPKLALERMLAGADRRSDAERTTESIAPDRAPGPSY